MIKRTQTTRWLFPTNCLRVFDHFVGLVLKGLRTEIREIQDIHAPMSTLKAISLCTKLAESELIFYCRYF